MKTFLTICFISVFCLAGWGQNRDDEPDTPEGLMIETLGRSLDSDGDGYPDTEDDEVYSPNGAMVNRNGVAYVSIRDCEGLMLYDHYPFLSFWSNDTLMALASERSFWDWDRTLSPSRAIELEGNHNWMKSTNAINILEIFYCLGEGQVIEMKIVAPNHEKAARFSEFLERNLIEFLGIEPERFSISMDSDRSMPTAACYFVY